METDRTREPCVLVERPPQVRADFLGAQGCGVSKYDWLAVVRINGLVELVPRKHRDITEKLLKAALNTKQSINKVQASGMGSRSVETIVFWYGRLVSYQLAAYWYQMPALFVPGKYKNRIQEVSSLNCLALSIRVSRALVAQVVLVQAVNPEVVS